MLRSMLVLVVLLFLVGGTLVSAQDPVELTIATVNNPDMVVMESFTEVFEAAYPNISLNWVILPENELRATVTTDVATGSSTFDIVTVGMFEAPIWAQNGWIHSVDDLAAEHPDSVQADYGFDDLLPGVKLGLSYENELYALPFYGESSIALPFYGESSMLFYNKAMFAEAGLGTTHLGSGSGIRLHAA